ncbi:interleukin-6 receptor subunit beta isoform X2 [Parambassis ranga]|uniref:Interleukin-6 receptor subunit beta isoform X2 n=1 Tax=Parambassis ranga TaxID=210632 RepID=A0A6P7HA22_9TELE|nr:interleukin-6 receptor subunit beta-like isoform X2 [Parambassis ranga]
MVLMELSPAVVWTCLLAAGLLVLSPVSSCTTCRAVPRPPHLTHCVFMYRGNTTCFWEPGDTPVTRYTLHIQRKSLFEPSATKNFTCTTTDTYCTIKISSPRIEFCITVIAHSGSRNISSTTRCQPGRREVMLPPVTLKTVEPVKGKPHCLNVTWSKTSVLSDFQVSKSEIEAGNLNSQIEVTAVGQLGVQVLNVTVMGYWFRACLFRPDTSYIIRLRHRYLGPESPWSLWSNTLQGRTSEDAPSAAPVFWRQVKQTVGAGWRFVSLFWKPLPPLLANGRVLFYNVTCQTGHAQVLSDHGSCRDLSHTNMSCSLLLPVGRSSCSLTASTSAGSSPKAHVWLIGASETEPPPPSQLTASPLDDHTMEVQWTAPDNQSLDGCVVEWSAVRETNSMLHWEKLNSSCTKLVITEGLKAMERYSVSVKCLYGEQGASRNRTLYIYTRQGTPSAGPSVNVQHISGSRVEISWSLVPVELRHGFIRNYTLHCTSTNRPGKTVFVPSHVQRYTLQNLMPGYYDIFMQANTDAGAGVPGNHANVHIGSDETSMVLYVVLPLFLTVFALVLMTCLVKSKTVQRKLFKDIPDPSSSSLSRWTPKTTVESVKPLMAPQEPDIKYSEVILLGEQLNCNPDHDDSYQSTCSLQASYQYSPLRSSEHFINSSTKVQSSSVTDVTTCSSIYSSILFPKTLHRLPAPFLLPSYQWSNATPHTVSSINDIKRQLGGAGEPSDSHLSPANEQNPFLRQHQGFSSASDPSIALPNLTEVTSPKHSLTQSSFNLPCNTLIHSGVLTDKMGFSPFHRPVFVDLSYCPVECDPYISFDV